MTKSIKQKKVLIVNNGSRYTEKIVEICQRHNFCVDEIDWESFRAHTIPHDILILSGGHQIPVQNHETEFTYELDFIRNSEKPIIGICLGFELIAKAFGSNLACMPKNEKNELSVSIVADDPIFEGIDKLVVYENHQWKVDVVSNVLLPLATSTDGIEIIRHKTKPQYGFQFHPEESTEDNCGIKLFENIFSLLRIGQD
jgi:GMP synthase-like glutamine amidotransferase